MISPVSAVSFRANANVDPISRPGAYTRPEAINQNPEQKTKKSTGKKIFTAIAVLAGIAAAAVGLGHLAKFGKLDKLAQKENFLGKIGQGLKTAGEWVNTHIVDKVVGYWNRAINHFKHKEATNIVA